MTAEKLRRSGNKDYRQAQTASKAMTETKVAMCNGICLEKRTKQSLQCKSIHLQDHVSEPASYLDLSVA